MGATQFLIYPIHFIYIFLCVSRPIPPFERIGRFGVGDRSANHISCDLDPLEWGRLSYQTPYAHIVHTKRLRMNRCGVLALIRPPILELKPELDGIGRQP